MAKRLPTEFAINMDLEKMMIIQQSELSSVNELNYFNEDYPCHLYFILRRARISIDPNKFDIKNGFIEMKFFIHEKGNKTEKVYKIKNNLKTENLKLFSEYPYNKFLIKCDNEILVDAKVSPFLQSVIGHADFLDFEVLYIGQSYGTEGARTAPDRLKNHSTLQSIYSEAISNNPDCEIFLGLTSFSQTVITVMHGKEKYSDDDLATDNVRRPKVMDKLMNEGITEQQQINFTEAALIKYFRPPYNVMYKDSFPNPAHKSYAECYDLDINAICIELHTEEMINCQFYSESVEKRHSHTAQFLLNSTEERKSIFQFFD